MIWCCDDWWRQSISDSLSLNPTTRRFDVNEMSNTNERALTEQWKIRYNSYSQQRCVTATLTKMIIIFKTVVKNDENVMKRGRLDWYRQRTQCCWWWWLWWYNFLWRETITTTVRNGLPVALRLTPVAHSALFLSGLKTTLFDRGWAGSVPE